MNSVSNMKSYSDLKDCIDNVKSEKGVVHRLFHYEPIANNPLKYIVKFGSRKISAMIHDKLKDITFENRKELTQTLDGVSSGAVLRGWLFEDLVHDTLSAGASF